MLMQTTPQRGRVRVGSQARVQDVCEGAPLGPTPAGGRRRKQWQSEKASCDAGPNLPTLKETLEPDCPSEMSGVGWDDQPLPHPPASHWMGIDLCVAANGLDGKYIYYHHHHCTLQVTVTYPQFSDSIGADGKHLEAVSVLKSALLSHSFSCSVLQLTGLA